MEGGYHFDLTPITPAGSEMLMHEKPGRRRTFGYNAKKAWYIAPYLRHYRTVKGIMASTGKERMSDTVKFKHHAISIPQLTPADIVLKQLDSLAMQFDSNPRGRQWTNSPPLSFCVVYYW